ncbi:MULTISPECIES: hypothetical protein [unclassified Yoonia]|uniref:hypothetical protein n=1 Tax=unclassified Yoonia TaxID=2629118 RepID=UPI002AFEDEE7|nr:MULTISPECIES: hypothetical protein [unclassified Yoonia]
MKIKRTGAGLIGAFAMLATPPAGLSAQSLSLNFAPPDMVVAPVCVPRAPDADIVADWGSWDGITLPDRNIDMINRDMRRLAELDALRWDDTITSVIAKLPLLSPSYTEDHVALARIEHMIMLGQVQQLKSLGLVQDLLDRGDANSPRMQNALAGYLTEGIGIDRDVVLGEEMLVNAGYGGNADALLILSQLTQQGQAPAGWNISPELAVTMAFGSLVGQIDPLICDRIARIAREFSNGGVVAVDHDLAVRWYRLAADLGDPIAAWRVAEYQLRSEEITKDNAILLTYLTKAADGGLPYAQVALGRVYEAGALVAADPDKALTLYQAAADSGDRAGLVRLSGFLETHQSQDSEDQTAFLATLDALAAIESPPDWVYSKLAGSILQEQGLWAGQDAAQALLEQGAALHDPVSIVMLARMRFGTMSDQADFYNIVDDLAYAVTTLGEVAPAAELQAAFLCKAPMAPLFEDVAYWAGVEAAIGSSSLAFTDTALAQLADDPDPMAMATLQTQALYGRATPLANLLDVMDRAGAPDSEQAFWQNYADGLPNVASARAALALDQATNPGARADALDLFRAAVAAGDKTAPLKLAKALLSDPGEAALAEAAVLLRDLAQTGNGEAMALLPVADPQEFPDLRAVYSGFAEQIAARGDFMALMLAMPFLPDAAGRDLYYNRAITAMTCTFPEALALGNVLGTAGDLDAATRWFAIADHLAGDVAWQIIQLGDAHRAIFGAAGDEAALAYFDKAFDLGSRTAVLRLLRMQTDPDQPNADQGEIASLYASLIARSSASEVPDILATLASGDSALRLAVEVQIDLPALYRDGAEAGDPVAMREHARRLRTSAVSVADLDAATLWLIRAAEANDVPAMVMLAQAYAVGVGVPVSLDDARGWLQKAADAGDPTAGDMVKLFEIEAEATQ